MEAVEPSRGLRRRERATFGIQRFSWFQHPAVKDVQTGHLSREDAAACHVSSAAAIQGVLGGVRVPSRGGSG